MDASKSFTYFIKAQTGDLERGFRKAGVESQQLSGKLGRLERQTLDVREASIKVERAQRAATRATERYGKESLEAAHAQVRLERAQDKAAASSVKQSRGLRGLSGAAKGAIAGIGVYGLAGAVRSVVTASVEAEKSQAKLDAQLRTIGKSSDAVKGKIDKVVQAQSLMSGFDDEALTDSFTNIVRTTGSVTKALELNNLAMDLARAKNLDVAKAGEIVAKVAGGNTGVLSRYGISIEKGSTATEALAALQKRLGGQAEAYGKTQAGSIERMNTAWENLREKLGNALAPAVTKAADGVAKFVTQLQDGTGAGGRFRDKVEEIWQSLKPTVKAIGDAASGVYEFARRHPQVTKLAAAMVAVGTAIKLIKFASKISGLSAFLSAARTGAATFVGIWRGAGTVAGTAASSRLGTSLRTKMPTSIAGTKAGVVGAFAKLGTAGGAAMAAAAALALPALVALVLREIGNAVKRAIDPQNKSDSAIGGAGGDKNNAVDLIKRLFKADGGPITGGTPGRDSVPAILMPGEHVLTAREVQRAGGHGAIFSMRRSLGGGGQSSGAAFADGGVVGKMKSAAHRIAQKNYPYAYGGGHGGLGEPSYDVRGNGKFGFDCSGYVSAILGAGGIVSSPMAVRHPMQGSLVRAAGKDDGEVVVGIRGTSAQNAHTMIRVGDSYYESGSGHGARKVSGWSGSFEWFKPRGAISSAGSAGSSGAWKDGVCTWYKPSAGGINGNEGAGAWAGHPIYDSTWGCAAPPEYPFGTQIEFRYEGRSVMCPVVDRGGAITGTHFDLLPGPAAKLGMQNAGRVKVKFRVRRKGTDKSKGLTVAQQRAQAAKKARSFKAKRQGIVRSVNANRGTRIDQGFENRYTLAGLTANPADDYQTAVQGYANADTKVRQLRYGLLHGDKRVTGEMLTSAMGERDSWAQRRGDATERIAAASERSSQFAPAAAGEATGSSDSAANLAAALAENTAAMNANREHAKVILSTTSGSVITGLIAAMASTGIGSSFNLANQTAGRGAGAYARY